MPLSHTDFTFPFRRRQRCAGVLQLGRHHGHAGDLRRGVQRSHLPERPLQELDVHDGVQSRRRHQRQVLVAAQILQHHEHRSGKSSIWLRS